ncbi:hypothetical protein [Pseudoalteromonas denitrificans]|uniref:Lipoprotein n=1 Tax=Pseudoalteromonas denitrificans DSM 6059 TaxID=1123010 RepID=A0A1I1LSI1_9GAMM|nr:hypothetical protein [Pseudoalteromonas denitrificans]SFC76197.1 hypothetical protein SAMN02745724_02497 [Pseudoalteromonas denitrificans DSM 6059]
MNFKKNILIILAVLLSGCETTEHHKTDEYAIAVYELFETMSLNEVVLKKLKASETNVPVRYQNDLQSCLDNNEMILYKAWGEKLSDSLSIDEIKTITKKLSSTEGVEFISFTFKGGGGNKKYSEKQNLFNNSFKNSSEFKKLAKALSSGQKGQAAGRKLAQYCFNKVVAIHKSASQVNKYRGR